jgi:hypothetical protein
MRCDVCQIWLDLAASSKIVQLADVSPCLDKVGVDENKGRATTQRGSRQGFTWCKAGARV